MCNRTKKPIVLCPGCKEPMLIKSRKVVLVANGMEDLTYACEICETETIRTVKRPPQVGASLRSVTPRHHTL